MEPTFNTLAIILKRDDWKENDSLITAYSESEGKLKLIARGAKKIKSKTAGHIEPLILSRLMVVRGKNDFNYVGTASGEEFYANIKDDQSKTLLAVQALNLVEKMTREGEVGGHFEVFDLLKNFLDELNKKSPLLLKKEPVMVSNNEVVGGDWPPLLTKERERGEVNNPLFAFSQKLTAILGFSREDFEELIRR